MQDEWKNSIELGGLMLNIISFSIDMPFLDDVVSTISSMSNVVVKLRWFSEG